MPAASPARRSHYVQGQRQRQGDPYPTIGEHSGERAAAVGARVEDVEELRQSKTREGHGLRVPKVAFAGYKPNIRPRVAANKFIWHPFDAISGEHHTTIAGGPVTSLPHPDHAAASSQPSEEPRYPKDHVVGVITSHETVVQAIDALSAAGFLPSEMNVIAGQAAAARLDASTGRSGLLDRIVRFADKLGIRDEEMEAKEIYEQALRDDQHIVTVSTLTEERKQLAAGILRDFGGKHIAHLGRFVITDLHQK